ncbi:putative cleavage and polyadenylation specificity factor subunit 1 [Tetrabaena socialis]|uniref:Putative cleavage and polyadenylation specificity factor subunit 1 n=1 Tax=Tetrabaena socialis TaxID=47790 RepID=A0A2J8ABD5_9CHLO|nr:putative cleavage and polyadenylation specificity factor subunit 1 [Tetrabaena socialis]|eukprot:PNH09816.1 putative cleavage and polyadenylation specificity factor subunit 1 [Tetrabaena socialis]
MFDPQREPPATTAARLASEYGLNVHPDCAPSAGRSAALIADLEAVAAGAAAAWLSPTTCLMSLQSGALLAVHLRFEGPPEGRIAVVRTGGGPVGTCLVGLTMAAAARAPAAAGMLPAQGPAGAAALPYNSYRGPKGLMFLGSWTGDSVLMQLRPRAAEAPGSAAGGSSRQQKRQRLQDDGGGEDGEGGEGAGGVAATNRSAAVAAAAAAFAAAAAAAGGDAATRYKLRPLDALPSLGPVRDLLFADTSTSAYVTGPSGGGGPDGGSRGGPTTFLCIGQGHSGAVVMARQGLLPEVVTEVALPAAASVFAVHHRTEDDDIAAAAALQQQDAGGGGEGEGEGDDGEEAPAAVVEMTPEPPDGAVAAEPTTAEAAAAAAAAAAGAEGGGAEVKAEAAPEADGVVGPVGPSEAAAVKAEEGAAGAEQADVGTSEAGAEATEVKAETTEVAAADATAAETEAEAEAATAAEAEPNAQAVKAEPTAEPAAAASPGPGSGVGGAAKRARSPSPRQPPEPPLPGPGPGALVPAGAAAVRPAAPPAGPPPHAYLLVTLGRQRTAVLRSMGGLDDITDFDHRDVVAAGVVVAEPKLHFMSADAAGSIQLMEFIGARNATPEFWAGQRLSPMGLLHVARRVSCCVSVKMATADGKNRQALLCGAAEGGLSYIAPLPDAAAAQRLAALQTHLSSALPHVAGLNPRAFRHRFCRLPKGLGGGEAHHAPLRANGLLDGQLLLALPHLSRQQQEAAGTAAGCSAAQLLADLRAVVAAAMFA